MRRPLALVAAVLLAGALASSAGATFTLSSVTPTTVTSSAVTLNGLDQTSTFTETLTTSSTTPFNGWNITAYAAVPTATGGKTLSQLVVTAQPSLAACSGFRCSLPTPTGITWPVTLGTTAGTATKIYNAASTTGEKTNTISVIFGVPVTADELPGSYSTVLTILGVSGP